jgi:hypothetical protein
MEKLHDIFQCKLYNKKNILNWELPPNVQKQLGINKYEYFFLAVSKEKKHKGHEHIHFSIFPSRYNNIQLLEVEVPFILPDTLFEILKILKKYNFDILTTSGYCNKKNRCYFGIFFTKSPESELESPINEIRKIENIYFVKSSKYTCEGYCQD